MISKSKNHHSFNYVYIPLIQIIKKYRLGRICKYKLLFKEIKSKLKCVNEIRFPGFIIPIYV